MRYFNFCVFLVNSLCFSKEHLSLERDLNTSNRTVCTYFTGPFTGGLDVEIKVSWTCCRCGSNNADYTLSCCQCGGSR